MVNLGFSINNSSITTWFDSNLVRFDLVRKSLRLVRLIIRTHWKQASEASSFLLEEEFKRTHKDLITNRAMGWVWIDDSSAPEAGNNLIDQPLGGNCSTTTVVRSQCKTEEVEPGKFVRKCDKTEETLRHCFGKLVFLIFHTLITATDKN